jgi:TrmH family RNA methyltransferase
MNRIESPKNNRIKEWKKLQTRKGREDQGYFLLEGPHLLEEGLKQNVQIADIIVLETFQIPNNWKVDHSKIWVVTERVMKELASTQQPQGIIAICPLLKNQLNIQQHRKYVLLDGIQDPGNLGTIIRTADSAGFDGVILGEGTVDVYNSKVIRSTQGSIFHLPVVTGNLEEWIGNIKEKQIPIYGTALVDAKFYYDIEPLQSFALILGNEGKGVNPHLLKQTSQNVYIPIYGQAESLNVAIAAGILFYTLSKHS